MYYAEPDPDDRSVINLMRRETRRLEAADPSTLLGESYVLCPGISRLKFSFYDYKNEKRSGGRSGPPWAPTACSTCPPTCASPS